MTDRKPRLLYVEDDEALGQLTRDQLEDAGMETLWLRSGTEAAELDQVDGYDLIVLDINLPGMDGFDLASRFRARSESIPILFLSARALPDDRIHGLRLGADDYLVKPFDIQELLLKIRIFLKRRTVNQDALAREVIPVGAYRLDKGNLILLAPDGSSRRMTSKEAELLDYLARHANRLIRRSQLLMDVWGNDDYFLGRSMDVFISRLRKYLAADSRIRIEAIHGIGFQFVCPV